MNARGVVAYTRVTPGEIGLLGMDTAAQETVIEAEVRQRGWRLTAVHRDDCDESVGPLSRHGLRAALADAAGADVGALMVARLDRIGFASRDFQWLTWLLNEAPAQFVALDLDSTPVPPRVLTWRRFLSIWPWATGGRTSRRAGPVGLNGTK